MQANDKTRRITIVGGGFTGIAYAIHLISQSTDSLEINIVEPAEQLGRGLAYGTKAANHRINVPSNRMSLFRNDPEHATRWMTEKGYLPDANSTDPKGHHYPSRSIYGAYVAATFAQVVASAGTRVTINHLRDVATASWRSEAIHLVQLASGQNVESDILVLALGHGVPALPCNIAATALASTSLIADPWKASALDQVGKNHSVLLVGTGLTMDDVLSSLLVAGHQGTITAISRRGLLAMPHGLFVDGVDFLQGTPPPATARDLLRKVRDRLRLDGASMGWHPILDGLRAQLKIIWPALPYNEKRRAIRRLLPYWEVHRFRVGPQIHSARLDAIQQKKAIILRAGIRNIELEGDALRCTLQPYGGNVIQQVFDRVILCTGPDKNLAKNPLIASLLDSGSARTDVVGGIDVTSKSEVLDQRGEVVPGLLAIGPTTRGTFGEMTGAPDIAQHLENLMQSFPPVVSNRRATAPHESSTILEKK